jgi:phosphopantetheine adenylyltransferase
MLVLANLLIEIVAETYGEVTSKKYLFVFKERVELICDWQSDMVVVQVVKNVFMFTLKPIFWCLSKMGFRKKHTD